MICVLNEATVYREMALLVKYKLCLVIGCEADKVAVSYLDVNGLLQWNIAVDAETLEEVNPEGKKYMREVYRACVAETCTRLVGLADCRKK